MPESPFRALVSSLRRAAGIVALFALAAVPAAADWLVTGSGRRIETRGPWKVEGERVVFTDVQGAPGSLRVSEVDLEASAAATAPRITLYATSWCGYCRKTRELLKELGTPYVEKDIEKSAEAQREYQAKGKGYRGVPLLDIGGALIRGYSPEEIRRRVAVLGKAPGSPAGESKE